MYVFVFPGDGLHGRAGLPLAHLSEIHGNSFVELCLQCQPPRETLRAYDVTAHSRLRHHATGHTCEHCGGPVQDTIVHFSEKNGHAPLTHNWAAAVAHAAQVQSL
jgi:NAD-dependent SIR2 family protein deacetylase